MVTKIRHLPQSKGSDDEKVYEAIEDAIASDTCTHVLMAAEVGGETSPVLTEANKRFVGALIPNVVAIEARGTKICHGYCRRKTVPAVPVPDCVKQPAMSLSTIKYCLISALCPLVKPITTINS